MMEISFSTTFKYQFIHTMSGFYLVMIMGRFFVTPERSGFHKIYQQFNIDFFGGHYHKLNIYKTQL